MLLLCSFVVIGFASGIAVSVIREARSVQPAEEDPWRRTSRGWENMRRWNPRPAARAAAQPHPMMLAGWMLIAGIGSLYCCSRVEK